MKQFEPTPLLPPVINTFLPDTQNRLDMISKAKCQTVYSVGKIQRPELTWSTCRIILPGPMIFFSERIYILKIELYHTLKLYATKP